MVNLHSTPTKQYLYMPTSHMPGVKETPPPAAFVKRSVVALTRDRILRIGPRGSPSLGGWKVLEHVTSPY